MPNEQCPLCDFELKNIKHSGVVKYYECNVCGKYTLTIKVISTKFNNVIDNNQRYILSGLARQHTENMKKNYKVGEEYFNITSDNIESLINSEDVPKDLIDLVDRLMLYIQNKSDGIYNNHIKAHENDYPLIYAKNKEEFRYALVNAVDQDYLKGKKQEGAEGPFIVSSKVGITLKGYKHLRELKKKNREIDRAFVAMWFPEKEKDYEYFEKLKKADSCIEKVLTNLGYISPFRVDKKQHNDKICEQIISMIKKSSLVIVDLTGNRGGVYFEAGYAKALDVPVIWMCQKQDFNKIHFDVRQYNHIIWENETDLEEELTKRIKGTILNLPNTKNTSKV